MLVKLKEITKNYETKRVLRGVSYGFEAGKCYALLGENGEGKSTLASIIAGFESPSSGCVEIAGRMQKNFTARAALKNGISYVPQFPLYAENISIYENIIIGSEFKTQLKGGELKNAVKKMNEKWGFHLELKKLLSTHKEALFSSILSAFIGNPRFILLDEADSTLEKSEKEAFFSKLSAYIKEKNAASLIITHENAAALNICDNFLFLSDGVLHTADKGDAQFFSFPEKKGNTNLHSLQKNARSKNYAEFRFKNHVFFAAPPHLTLVKFKKTETLHLFEQKILKSATLKNSDSREADGKFVADLNGKKYEMDLKNPSYSPRFLRKIGAALLPLDKRSTASDPALSVKELLTATLSSSAFRFKEKGEMILKMSGVNTSLFQKVSALSGGMRAALILARELFSGENLKMGLFFEPLHGLDPKKVAKVCRTLHDFAKTAAVMVFTQSEFPVNSEDEIIIFD